MTNQESRPGTRTWAALFHSLVGTTITIEMVGEDSIGRYLIVRAEADFVEVKNGKQTIYAAYAHIISVGA